MGITTDSSNPKLGRGVDTEKVDQHEVYLVLSDEEKAKGFTRPLRKSYKHSKCGTITTMGLSICETYARDPYFYGSTYCISCSKHLPVKEFNWTEDDEVVGS